MTEMVKPELVYAEKAHSVSDKNIITFNEMLASAIEELSNTEKKIVIVSEDGGESKYTPVHVRMDIFRKHFGLFGRIQTSVATMTDGSVQAEAKLDILMDGKFVRIANAFAHKGGHYLVKYQNTSLTETAETSAIGRVLANIGLAGGEFASVEDVAGILNNDKEEDISINIQKAQIKEIKELAKSLGQDISELIPKKYPEIESVPYTVAETIIKNSRKKLEISEQTTESKTKKKTTKAAKTKKKKEDENIF